MKVEFANSSTSSGRLLYETATWRWIYYIYVIVVGKHLHPFYPILTFACSLVVSWISNVVFLAVELVLFFFFYHPRDSVSVLSVRSRLRRLDFGGMILASAGLTLCTLGLSWGGNPKPWTSGMSLTTLFRINLSHNTGANVHLARSGVGNINQRCRDLGPTDSLWYVIKSGVVIL